MQTERASRWLIIGAFAVVYVVWGSTYLVNYLAIQGLPPFIMSGSRFVAAGLLLYAAGRLWGHPVGTREHWCNGMFAGVLLLGVGTGGVVWAMQWVDTGIAALIVAFEPLLVVLLLWVMRGQRPGGRSLLGVAVGIAGMAVLVLQDKLIADRETAVGVGVIFVGILAWGYAAIWVGRAKLPASSMQTAAMQMLGGGGALLLFSLFTGEWGRFDWALVTPKTIFAWLYLVGLGSILAFSAFNYLLARVSPEKVVTTNYVNPVVALFLGWSLNNEVITLQSLIASVLLLAGVFFIVSRKGKA
ncbi:MAG: EamA family transporter [Saprospiraceae bacterium]|nr:EamA family transporter [Saprospiraceae bacterium]